MMQPLALLLSYKADCALCAGSAWEQHFVRQVIELHDKYMLYVGGCFANSSLFHKALKEAFEFFCNKNVAGTSTAELMANFCDNLLRKVCFGLAQLGCTCRSTAQAVVSAASFFVFDVALSFSCMPFVAYKSGFVRSKKLTASTYLGPWAKVGCVLKGIRAAQWELSVCSHGMPARVSVFYTATLICCSCCSSHWVAGWR